MIDANLLRRQAIRKIDLFHCFIHVGKLFVIDCGNMDPSMPVLIRPAVCPRIMAIPALECSLMILYRFEYQILSSFKDGNYPEV